MLHCNINKVIIELLEGSNKRQRLYELPSKLAY